MNAARDDAAAPDDPTRLGAAAIAAAVRQGEISTSAVLAAHWRRIETVNPRINAFSLLCRERAEGRARKLDAALQAGAAPPLAGVPFAVKNLFDIQGEVTVAGARINADDRRTAAADATLIGRLEAAGAVLLGALHMGEYAYDFTGENAHFGTCRNPWDARHVAGGSSSGSGAALAAGAVPLTLGTDTNGSIRVPASFCGVWGLKATYGRLSRAGAYPFCDSLDHVGPMARSVADLAASYNALQGYDPLDHGCVERAAEPVSDDGDVSGLRVAIAGGYFRDPQFPRANAAVDAVAEALAGGGAVIEEMTLPLVEAGRSAAFIITNAEGAHLHRSRLQRRAGHFDPEIRDRFLAGSLLPSGWYLRAQRVRHRYAREMAEAMAPYDLVLAPSTPFPAPPVGRRTVRIHGRRVGLRANVGYFTQPISCIGLPVVAAPVLPSPGALPMGVQLIGKPWQERNCFRAAWYLERHGTCGSPVAPLGPD